MDWQIAISRNRDALLGIIVALMKTLGLADGGALTTLPFCLYRKALRIIRPAEAAVRRLIIMAMYEMQLRGVTVQKPRAPMSQNARPAIPFPDATNFAPSFNLIDPLKTYRSETPDYTCFGTAFNTENQTFEKTPILAAGLGRRLFALKNALSTIEKQARRLARWYRVRDLALKTMQPHRLSPLRPGFPPGYAKRPTLPVDEILLDCHSLAQFARERRDSP